MRVHVILLIAFGGVLAIGSKAFAQQPARQPDFRGVWRMDTTKFEKRDALLSALELSVSQRGDTLSIITDVADTGRAPIQMRSWYLPAASPGLTAASDSRATADSFDWQGDTLVLRRTERRPERTLEIEERWALDASGNTLARYQRVRDGARLSQQTLLFTRL
jgi:hypothetical protein